MLRFSKRKLFSFLSNLKESAQLNFSLQNTHAIGLYSIVFEVGPPMIRMYFADSNHELWKNELQFLSETEVQFPHEMSIAVHSHRQDITLVPIFGSIFNLVFSRVKTNYDRSIILNSYKYSSPIINQIGKFNLCSKQSLFYSSDLLPLQENKCLEAHELHTVFIPRNTMAAWFVLEGEKDQNYDSACYSNSDLENFDFTNLYNSLTLTELEMISEKIQQSL